MPHLQIHHYRLHYQWAEAFDPERATLVFLHDGLGAAGSWRDVPRLIGAALGANALVYDRFGYGDSQERRAFGGDFMEGEVPVLLALLAALGVGRAHLIGHSDGGSIALLTAAWHPERVGAVVTEAAHTFVEPETQAGIQALVDLQKAGKTPGWLGRLHGPRAESLLAIWSGHWLGGEHAAWDIRPEIRGIACPLLVIQGAADEFGTVAQVDSILAAAPQGESWLVPGCGHTPHTQAEGEFVRRVVDFLRPLLAGGPGG